MAKASKSQGERGNQTFLTERQGEFVAMPDDGD
jgi:hypothetical protein